MKFLTVITILFTHFLVAQQVKELNEKYILKTEQLQDGVRTLEIVELTNSPLYWEVRDKVKRRIRPDTEDINKSLESKKFTPTEGNYFLKNNDQKFRFTIDKNGNFSDRATFENNDFGEMEYWNFAFDNGKISTADLKQTPEGNVIEKIVADDDSFVTTYFSKNTGKMTKKRIIKKGGNWQNSFLTEYYEDGSIKSENDGMKKIRKYFYENGKQRSFENSETNETIDYDKTGLKTEHSYPTKDKGWCREYFENGLITSKKCNSSNHSQKTNYEYKNGKLDSYEIEDGEKGEIKKYDKNKKLISTEKAVYIQAGPRQIP